VRSIHGKNDAQTSEVAKQTLVSVKMIGRNMENCVPNDGVSAELSYLIDRPEAFVPKFRGICFFCSRQSLVLTVRRSNAGHQEVPEARRCPKDFVKAVHCSCQQTVLGECGT
jgi:hypothetical protein